MEAPQTRAMLVVAERTAWPSHTYGLYIRNWALAAALPFSHADPNSVIPNGHAVSRYVPFVHLTKGVLSNAKSEEYMSDIGERDLLYGS